MKTSREMKARREKLSDRTCGIILKNGIILLKKGDSYIHQWTNIAAGPDHMNWTYQAKHALEFFNLEWAFVIAPLYSCKVVVRYPTKRG